MIRTVLIDDEIMSIENLKYALSSYKEVEIIGTFAHPLQALKVIDRLMPHVVFLDIEMPEISGIALAREILKVTPDACIVFVTAFNEYSNKIPETNMLDFVLKPVSKRKLYKTMKKLYSRLQHQ
jgi:DNA-binding LytR/AlgR family response regulator